MHAGPPQPQPLWFYTLYTGAGFQNTNRLGDNSQRPLKRIIYMRGHFGVPVFLHYKQKKGHAHRQKGAFSGGGEKGVVLGKRVGKRRIISWENVAKCIRRGTEFFH
jgi:hypothetical protein